jgi:uncharacterized protein YecE (DUF72 family)
LDAAHRHPRQGARSGHRRIRLCSFIGDRKDIEGKTKKWDRLVEDKTAEMTVWTNELKKIVTKGVKSYAFFNNRYAGFAPGSVKLFEDLWEKV